MRSSVKRIGLVCAIVLVSALLVVIAAYPRTATGAAQPAASAVSAPLAQSASNPVDSALPADPYGPQFSGLAPSSGVGPTPPPVNGVPGYMWNYSAKFVCGRQKFPNGIAGEPPVKPANYATEINIHNYNYKGFVIRKKVVLVVEQDQVIGREPNAQGPRTIVNADIGPDFVMMDDCNAIWGMVYTQTLPLPSPMPLMIGYLVVISPLDLDIDAVYTAAEPSEPNAAGGTTAITAIAIDVNRVLGKRVFVPQ